MVYKHIENNRAFNEEMRCITLNEIVSHIANVLSAPIVMSWGALPITLESSTAITPPS